ncbi:MAG: phosphate ABC transporter permease subunit PstC [Chloroflexi bacterium]|nr:phosphate ABC transporter permease subunit PstC [Chloroflexota bacterium]
MLSLRPNGHLTDQTWRWTIFLCGLSGILVLALVIIFILREAWPVITEVGLWDMVSGTVWRPGRGEFGLLPFIVGTLYVTALALLMAVPIGIFCAIFLAEVAPQRVRQVVRPGVELLVGIPSVVYGLVGLVLLVPQIGKLGGYGDSILAGAIVVSVMVLPTIVSVSEDSIRAVPRAYKEGALALGSTRWQMMWHVVLPAARSGILAAMVLGMGRAIGETMAVYMVMGNSLAMPNSPLDAARTLTTTPALEVKYAAGLHWNALFADGVVLLIFILALNSIAMVLRRRQFR